MERLMEGHLASIYVLSKDDELLGRGDVTAEGVDYVVHIGGTETKTASTDERITTPDQSLPADASARDNGLKGGGIIPWVWAAVGGGAMVLVVWMMMKGFRKPKPESRRE